IAWLHILSWTLTRAGLGLELAAALEPLGVFPWVRAAIAYAEGKPTKAADICAEMGAVSEEAFDRLAAARQLADESRHGEADEQLRRALGFYRSVGATRYLRESEVLLTASV